MAAVDDVELPARGGPRPARVYRPSARPGPFTLVYVHGGGYVVGGIDESDAECRRFATSLRCDVVSVSYRLAPEHPWPAGVDDGEDMLRAIAGGAVAGLGGPIGLAGVSAGAGLAAAVVRRSLAGGPSPVRLLVLMSPWLDTTITLPATHLYATGYILEREPLIGFCRAYIPDGVSDSHPELSPVRHPVPAGWPETVLFAAERDPLADDSSLFARRLAEAGIDHHVRFVPGMLHGFHGWWDHIPAIKPDIDWLDGLIASRLGGGATPN
jgi:acetyl esterase